MQGSINTMPRLMRLPPSRSITANAGFLASLTKMTSVRVVLLVNEDHLPPEIYGRSADTTNRHGVRAAPSP